MAERLYYLTLFTNTLTYFQVQSNEEGRKAAYDALHGISSKLRSSSDASSDELYHKLLTMVSATPIPHHVVYILTFSIFPETIM